MKKSSIEVQLAMALDKAVWEMRRDVLRAKSRMIILEHKPLCISPRLICWLHCSYQRIKNELKALIRHPLLAHKKP